MAGGKWMRRSFFAVLGFAIVAFQLEYLLVISAILVGNVIELEVKMSFPTTTPTAYVVQRQLANR